MKWCNIEKKYTNHETHDSHFRLRYENQQMGQQQMQQQQPPLAFRQKGYGRGQVERPPPILGQQPPLPMPNQPTIVNLAQSIESPMEQMQALVPIVPYANKASSLALVEA